MKYQNIKTGFVFESDSECKGEGWVKLNPRSAPDETNEEKPVKTKRTKKDGNSK